MSFNKNKSALIVADIQNDFFSGGSLEIPNSLEIIPIINRIKQNNKIDITIYSKDWHPNNHASFVEYGGKWPKHCEQFSNGAKLHQLLNFNETDDYIVHKGTDFKYDSCSAFYNSKENNNQTSLYTILEEHNVNTIYICGLASEYCVYGTALDIIKDKYQRYSCYLIEDATVGFNKDVIKKKYDLLSKLGVNIINSAILDKN
jgi:nicotinamidase/pyrazinamidase